VHCGISWCQNAQVNGHICTCCSLLPIKEIVACSKFEEKADNRSLAVALE